MRKFIYLFILSLPVFPHFMMLLPTTDIVESRRQARLKIIAQFCHPFEQNWMDLERPDEFGVFINGKKTDLIQNLKMSHRGKNRIWVCNYKIESPGDHIFYIKPKPYFEPAEGKFIVHYAKVVVDAYGLESGWDMPIGLEMEIVPLTRPYGLYAGNVFSGVVLKNGRPLPDAEVEVEFYNVNKTRKAPSQPFITQVVKTDKNGVFHYAIPWPGWWGFAALSERDKKMVKDGKKYPVEIGGIMWIHAEAVK